VRWYSELTSAGSKAEEQQQRANGSMIINPGPYQLIDETGG
jgi:hypothetical protein